MFPVEFLKFSDMFLSRDGLWKLIWVLENVLRLRVCVCVCVCVCVEISFSSSFFLSATQMCTITCMHVKFVRCINVQTYANNSHSRTWTSNFRTGSYMQGWVTHAVYFVHIAPLLDQLPHLLNILFLLFISISQLFTWRYALGNTNNEWHESMTWFHVQGACHNIFHMQISNRISSSPMQVWPPHQCIYWDCPELSGMSWVENTVRQYE